MSKSRRSDFQFKLLLGLLAVGSTVFAASTDTPNARKPAPPPEAAHPVPDRRTPPSASHPSPPTNPVRTVSHPPWLPRPINREPVLVVPAASNHPEETPFTEIVTVFFTNGARRGFTTLDSTDGHRLQVDAYTVTWRLPRGQSGTLDFAPFFPSSPNRPSDQCSGLYADPGEPLRIGGARTDGDGAGTAEIVFTGEETAVPREQKDPAGP